MSRSPQTPVLVGVGQLSQRVDDPREGAEPLELMLSALKLAAEDACAPGLLARADSVRVIRGAWKYGDPARELASRIGADGAESVGTQYGGNFVQVCVNDAALAIQAGREDVVLVAGAENGRSFPLSRRQGVRLETTECPGEPDRVIGADHMLTHPAELARQIVRPTQVYAMFESAIRHARGESLEAHKTRISELWASFNAVACNNPHAWIRKPYTPEQIGTASPDNPMICLPYPRLMNSNSRVDMGAALILCSLETARSAGVPDEKLVYLHAGTQANDAYTPSTREHFHRSPAIRIAGKRVLELAEVAVEDVDYFDVYSCFPSAVQVGAAEVGIPADRKLTVTGGLTFGGGPLNDYVMHSIARMAEVLREDRGARGLVTANGGYLSKHAFGVYSTEPPAQGFRCEDLQAQVDAMPQREALVDYEGSAEIESYTVAYEQGEPKTGHLSCLTPEGARTWANVVDADVIEAMTREEFVGRRGRVDGKGVLELA
jgi:acetyl-CoA C-acetyltransferase